MTGIQILLVTDLCELADDKLIYELWSFSLRGLVLDCWLGVGVWSDGVGAGVVVLGVGRLMTFAMAVQ